MKEIQLSKGMVALVDDCDFEELSKHSWYAAGGRNGKPKYAARCNLKDGHILMHRQILGFPKGQVEHKNRNGCDNRRENLRLANQNQNNYNRAKYKRLGKTTSEYKGVVRYTPKGKWCAVVTVNRKRKHLGSFETEIEAAKAYDAAIREIAGEYALTNFKEESHVMAPN